MKKTLGINAKFVAVVAILMAAVISVSALLLSRSTIAASAAVSNNCGYNSENVYVDYSGRGTVINGKLTGDAASVNGNNVDIPIYKAAYEANSGWNWFWKSSSWSGWTTYNYKSTDYNTYRGDKATEYQVESRKEYKYKRYESRDVYSTKYHTTYQGTKWYNWWIFLFTDSWSGYGGAKSGYKIVNRYTKQEKSGTKQVMVYKNEWRTSAPFSWAWEDSWKAYDSRTTYRYRSLEMKWSDTAQKTTEQVPLNYSLYDRHGAVIEKGIKWQLNHSLTEKTGFWFFGKNDADISENTQVIQYYIPSEQFLEQFEDNIELIQTDMMSDHLIEDIISGVSGISIEAVVALLAKRGVESLSTALGNIGTILAIYGIIDSIRTCITYQQLVEFVGTLDKAKENEDTIIINVERTVNYGNLFEVQTSGVSATKLCTVIVPIIITPSNTKVEFVKTNKITSVSMKFDAKRNKNLGCKLGFHDDKAEYGNISYITGFSEIVKYVELYSKGI